MLKSTREDTPGYQTCMMLDRVNLFLCDCALVRTSMLANRRNVKGLDEAAAARVLAVLAALWRQLPPPSCGAGPASGDKTGELALRKKTFKM